MINEVLGNAAAIGGGQNNSATADYASVPGGYGNLASGRYSFAAGHSTEAQAYISTVIGQSNVISGTQDTWVDTEPLFVIGNGSFDGTVRSNAMTILKNGKVGIGTTTPGFKLSLDGDGGILAEGTYGSGDSLSIAGTGTRFMWYPKKAAIRAGQVSGIGSDFWNDADIGDSSVAFGLNSLASGMYTTVSGGNLCYATGDYSTVSGGGMGNLAGGEGSVISGGTLNVAQWTE